jgi:hypothetical protein
LRSGEAVTGGIVLTPPELRGLARVIGYDLDYRFLRTPEGYVTRHPNMNLGAQRDLLLRLRFNEALAIGYDTDLGYRLASEGKRIRFTRKAEVLHYHRSTWRAFVRQQTNSISYFLRTARDKRPGIARDDNINPRWMQLQAPALWIVTLGIIVGIIFAPVAAAVVVALALAPFYYPAVQAGITLRRPRAAFALFGFYLARATVWTWAYVRHLAAGGRAV